VSGLPAISARSTVGANHAGGIIAGFQAISQRCPSGSWKQPAYPPQKVGAALLTIDAPAFPASSITASTSAALATLRASMKPVGDARFIGDAFPGPEGEPQTRLEIEKGHRAVLELPADDALGREAQSVPVENEGPVEIIDAKGDQGDARSHGRGHSKPGAGRPQ